MASVTELWSYRNLIANLAQRELKAKYKRSVLGWLWSLINPATTLLIYSVVFGVFLKIEPPVAGNGELKNFALYLFAALVVWNFFSAVLTGSMGSLVSAGPLLRKVYFPAECPPIANMLAVLSQTAIEAGILAAVMIVLGNASLAMLLFPVLLAMLVLFSIGLGLMLSLANVYFRDVGYLVTIGLNLLFYGTPIIYPFTLVQDNAPEWVERIIQLNPLTQFVGASRDVFYLAQAPSASRLAGLAVVSLAMFVVGRWVFALGARDVSEEL